MDCTLVQRVLLKTFQKRSVSSPAPVTMASPSGDTAWEVKIRKHTFKMLWKHQWGNVTSFHNGFYTEELKLPPSLDQSTGTWMDLNLKAEKQWQLPSHQIQHSVRVSCQLGHLCQWWILPHQDLVLGVAVSAHLSTQWQQFNYINIQHGTIVETLFKNVKTKYIKATRYEGIAN